MFCPKCATQNAEGAKFCRTCGADISLVPAALSGHLAEQSVGDAKHMRHGRKGTPTIDSAVMNFFMGIAFVLVALSAFFWFPGAHRWWFWMLIPALGLIGSGVGIYLRVREERGRLAPSAFAPAQTILHTRAVQPTELPPRRDTGEIVPPPSVTEGTTRHLAMPAERTKSDV